MKIVRPLLVLGIAALVGACGLNQYDKAGQPGTGAAPPAPPVPQASAEQTASAASLAAAHQVRPSGPAMARKFMGAADQASVGFMPPQPVEKVDRENYQRIDANPVHRVAESPVSTFSIDVDTGAYANVRRILMQGALPPGDAVRVEELINYFSYQDPLPESADEPFNVNLELGPNPWNSRTRLLRVALRSEAVSAEDLPPANLVFLVDVSGSMHAKDKLPLLKRSLNLLVRELDADDRVSIVVYAGASGVVLEPTAGDQAATIEQALNELEAGGSTNGGDGIRLAYAKARESFIRDGINRVIIATDGDFNVGTVSQQALLDLIEDNRRSGISLTTLGFGSGNYNDALMEQLADHGNGNHAYIDSLLEARKVLVEQIGGTLKTVASDVKVQIEFNPARVSEYRLIGYENRLLAREDFNNDQVDAGEIGAGHSVVALYEIALAGQGGERVEPLRYARPAQQDALLGDELAMVKLRYKLPGQASSELMQVPLGVDMARDSLAQTSDDYRFAAAVAAFGQRLRDGKYLEGYDYEQIIELARHSRGLDPQGYRSDFLRVAGLAHSLDGRVQVSQAGIQQAQKLPVSPR